MGIALGAWVAAPESVATDINGSARVYGGNTETDGNEADVLDQKYSLTLFQPFAPYLSLFVNYRYNQFNQDNELFPDFERRSSLPTLDLVYSAPTFDMRLTYQDRSFSGSNPADNLDQTSFLGFFSWRPHRGPSYTLTLQEGRGVGEEIFGRDNESRSASLDIQYERPTWQIGYNLVRTEVLNNITDLGIDQTRHILRFDYSNRWWDDRFTLSSQVWLQQIDQESEFVSGTINQPLAPQEGLFAIDTSPSVGPLGPAPELIDGDTTAPVTPPIDIGGAATFRNIGLDLGITRQVTRLDIFTDQISGSSVMWEVWISTDNLSWAQVPGVLSSYDVDLLRYELTFPETTARFFKAVNVSVNTQPAVLVTEIRALLEVQALAREDGQSTSNRFFLFSNFNPSPAVESSFTLGYQEDADVGTLSRETLVTNFGGAVRVRIFPKWRWLLGYDYVYLREDITPMLERTEQRFSTGFEWSPLAMANGLFDFEHRTESDDGGVLRDSDTIRVRFWTEFFPTLGLVSEIFVADIVDNFAGFKQKSLTWRETLNANLTSTFDLDTTMTIQRFDSVGTVRITFRDSLDLFARWRATPYVYLTGGWRVTDDDFNRNYNQMYTFGWTPGPKLSFNASYQDNQSPESSRTNVSGAALNYRINQRLTLWASYTRSSSELSGLPTTRNESGRFGIDWFF